MMKNYFKKSLVIMLFGLLMSPFAKAQEFLPFLHDNFSGATGMLDNPASIAGSRYKFDMTLFGLNTTVYNNFISVDKKYITNKWFDFDAYEGTDPKADGQVHVMTGRKGKTIAANVALQLQALNFMVSINDKISVGFQTRVRTSFYAKNISWDLANHAYEENNDGAAMNEKDLSVSANAWAEYGLTYAQTLIERQQHSLKAGITVKYLQGLGAAYIYSENANFNYTAPDDTVRVQSADIHMGFSENLDDNFTLESLGTSLAFDIGVEYEWRPDHAKFRYEMDGKQDLLRRDVNKYKLKVGVSILDIGSIKYKKAYGSQDYNIENSSFHKNYFDGAGSIQGFINMLDTLDGASQAGGGDDFKMTLPTSLSINIDYQVAKNVYVNFAPYLALNNGTSDYSKVRNMTTISLTPRYETPWFGVSVPFQYNQIDNFDMGVGLRLGPVWIGSNNIFTNMFQKELNAVNLAVALKIPILHRGPKDRDGDKVSDKMDECIDDFGTLEMQGCPDTDGDGIADNLDECVDVFGLAEFNGCPDTDGDGIIDKLDDCPDVYGLAIFNGCPDTDGDSIIDMNDKCPNVFGLLEFEGCPDADGDGLPDNLDLCPTIAGPIELDGCPDTDGDGVLDKDDKCIEEPGPISNFGCPIEVIVVIEEDEDVITTTVIVFPSFDFSNIEFASSKAILLPVSYSELDRLAETLKEYPTITIDIKGYTDATGNDGINIPLSKRRAKSVKTYLEKKGIAATRITSEGYGSANPIATNNTKEGRAKNRRVEIVINK